MELHVELDVLCPLNLNVERHNVMVCRCLLGSYRRMKCICVRHIGLLINCTANEGNIVNTQVENVAYENVQRPS